MIYLITVIHIIVCFALIGIVLLQPGTGADLAGAFGGQGSQTAFGPRGTVNVLTKVTTWLAIIFAITSISLTILVAREGTGRSVLSGIKSAPITSTGTTPVKHK
jgi:preprotein translocase subunit SecG